MQQLEQVTREVVTWLKAKRIDYALIGGLEKIVAIHRLFFSRLDTPEFFSSLEIDYLEQR